MKKKCLLLILMVLLPLNGCTKSDETVETQVDTERVETIDTEENSDTEVEESLDTSPNEEEENEVISEQTETLKTENEEQTKTPRPSENKDTPVEENKENNSSVENEPPKESENVSIPVVNYNPNTIVQLATDRLKAIGKVTLTDNLDRLLAEGSITQEEYNEYYPYDGAGYYSVFMETDLNEAKTTSGRKLRSEEEIAEHIAEMLAIEPGPFFLIEYAGVYTTGGNDFYEFRCYRA